MTSAAAQKAFDIHREPDKVRDAYGRNAFGQRALLARRLVEAGVPFVTLYDGGWDHHSDIFSGLPKKLPPFENAIATLIEDLEARGLLDTTLVVALGEFGRTPKISHIGRSQDRRAATTGPTPCRSCSPAAARPADRSSARPTATATPPASAFCRPRISSRRSTASSASIPARSIHARKAGPSHLVSDPTPISELMG